MPMGWDSEVPSDSKVANLGRGCAGASLVWERCPGAGTPVIACKHLWLSYLHLIGRLAIGLERGGILILNTSMRTDAVPLALPKDVLAEVRRAAKKTGG